MGRGGLITFSGIDGAGKSTQIALVMEHLHGKGERPVYLWTRGGYTPLFEGLKAILRRLAGRAVPPPGNNPRRAQALGRRRVRRLWLALAILDLLLVYGVKIRWLRWRGRSVVCDRYLWDTLIDFRLYHSVENVERWFLWRLLAGMTPRADAAFLILVPVEESVRRSDLKGEPFRDPPGILAKRLAEYEALLGQPGWHPMDGRRPIPDLAAEVQAVLRNAAGEPVHTQETAPADLRA